VITLVLVVVAVVGGSTGVGSSTASIDWTKAETVFVALIDYRFVPDHLAFRRGVPYRLRLENVGVETHEFTTPEFLKAITIGNPGVVGTYGREIVIQPHEQKDLYFVPTQIGRSDLRCADHDWAGMGGEIVVQ
jgi:uncharacterized cupredoxin-like copper-binding protein